MEFLRKIGKVAAGFLAAAEVIGQITVFLALPALIVICGILNEYPAQYYIYTLSIYLILYIAVRLTGRLLSRWFERRLRKASSTTTTTDT